MYPCLVPDVKKSINELKRNIDVIKKNYIDILSKIGDDFIAVLSDTMQIIYINDKFSKFLEIENMEEIFGLRLGDTLNCIHSTENNGCGNSEFCSTCGAAISLVTSLCKKKTTEKFCVVDLEKNGKVIEYCFEVKSIPISIENDNFIILVLKKINDNYITRRFEIFNTKLIEIIERLRLISKLSKKDKFSEIFPEEINLSINEMYYTMDLFNSVNEKNNLFYQPTLEKVPIDYILLELEVQLNNCEISKGKTVEFYNKLTLKKVLTDKFIILKILYELSINALEATRKNGKIKIEVFSGSDGKIIFSIWNEEKIDYRIQKRIFQKFYSTKDSKKRGFGTFYAKFMATNYIASKIEFSSNEESGTTFLLIVPENVNTIL